MAISLAVKIWGDSTPLLTELEKVKKQLNLVSKELTKMGSQLTQALTLPIVAFGAIAVKEFGEAEKASVTLSAALTANGKNAEELSSQYRAFAEELSKLTTISRDSAIGLLALAENMKAPDAKKATQDAIGLSKAYGVDMERAMKIAVQAQEGQYKLLGRMVPVIKDVKDTTQQAAMAQKIFTDSFSVAQAQAKSGLGPLEQTKNALAELSESFGKIIVDGITPMIKNLKSFAAWMDSLSETTKKWIVAILATVAVVGPLLLVLGKIPVVLSSIINGVTLLAGAFKSVGIFLISNPWVALAAAIAAAGAALGYFLAKAGDAHASNTEQNREMEAMRKRQEADAAETRKYMALDEAGRKKMIDELRNEANGYVKLYEERRKANDTAGMKYYKEQVEDINALVAQMKDAVRDSSKGVIGGIDDETNAYKNLKQKVSDLEDQYKSETLSKDPNAAATGKLLAAKKLELENVDKLTKGLEDESNAYKKLQNEVSKLQEKYDAALAKNAKTIDGISSEKLNVEALIEKIKNENTSKADKLKAIKALQDISPKYFGGLTLEKAGTDALINATKGFNDSCDKEIKAKNSNIEATGKLLAVKQQDLDRTSQLIQNSKNYIKQLEEENAIKRMATPEQREEPRMQTVTGGKPNTELIENLAKEQAAYKDLEQEIAELRSQYDNEVIAKDANADATANLLTQKTAELDNLSKLIEADKTAVSLIDNSTKSHAELVEEIKKEQVIYNGLQKNVSDLQIQYNNEVATKNINAKATGELLAQKKQELTDIAQFIGQEKVAIGLMEQEINLKKESKDEIKTSTAAMVFTPPAAQINPQKGDAKGAIDEANAAIKSASTLAGITENISNALNGMTGSLGPLADSFKKTFSSISTLISDAATKFGGDWNQAMNDVGAVVSSVIGTIGSIIDTSFSNREREMSDYYSSEKDAIENSTMTEQDKSAALTKIGKEEQKERKKLAREQAKDQKEISLVQAIIAGALATVMAYTAGPGIGEVLAIVVAALSAIEIAAIAAQPLPSLAEGGLAFAPTMAMVGDNPNASMDPEVIAPFSKIKSLFQGTQQVELHSVLKGADIYLSSERGGVQVQRIRGY